VPRWRPCVVPGWAGRVFQTTNPWIAFQSSPGIAGKPVRWIAPQPSPWVMLRATLGTTREATPRSTGWEQARSGLSSGEC